MIFSGLCLHTEFPRDFSTCLQTKWLWVSQCGEGRDVKNLFG